MMNKIYIFKLAENNMGVLFQAIAEDGEPLGNHVSTDDGFARQDMQSEERLANYKDKYPDGYEIEWVKEEEIKNHHALQKSFQENIKLNETLNLDHKNNYLIELVWVDDNGKEFPQTLSYKDHIKSFMREYVS